MSRQAGEKPSLLRKKAARPLLQFPLLAVLVIPFVLEIVIVVGLTGYLSTNNRKQVVRNLAHQFTSDVSNRVRDQIDHTLKTPPQLASMTTALAEMGSINLVNFSQVGQFFEKQQQTYPDISSIALTSPKGESVTTYGAEGTTKVAIDQRPANSQIYRYVPSLQNHLAPLKPNRSSPAPPQPALPPLDNPGWSDIYHWFDNARLGISFRQPVYQQNGILAGELTIGINLDQLNHLLQALNLDSSSRVFIIERSGMLVASSATQLINVSRDGNIERLKASRSDDLLISETASYLAAVSDQFQSIQKSQQFTFDLDHERQFVQVTPYRDRFGLDWLIVVAVPENHFMAEINYSLQTVLLFCIAALIGAAGIGWLTAQWIAKPILRLSRASCDLTLGKWSDPIPENSHIVELETLARTFNQMAEHLQESFDQVKNALQESEEKFTKVFRVSPMPMAIATLEGRYLDVNDAFVHLFGYTHNEVVGQTYDDISLWANPENRKALMRLLQQQKKVLNQEQIFRKKSGEEITVLFSSEIIEIKGQPCVIGVAQDISARKQAEAESQKTKTALQASEERFRTLVANIPGAVYRCPHSENWQGMYVSDSISDIAGLPAAAFAEGGSLTFLDIVYPEDIDRLNQVIQGALQNRQPFTVEYRIVHANGTVKWVYERGQGVFTDDRLLWIDGVIFDVTEQKLLEIALQNSEAQLKDVLNSVNASVTSMRIYPNGDWQYEYWSKGCETVFGYTPAEFMADRNLWLSRIPPADLAKAWMAYPENFRIRRTFSEEYRFRHKDNSLRWILGHVTSRQDETGNGWLVTAVDIDITDRKRVEEALRESEQHFRSAFDAGTMGLTIASVEGKFLKVNRVFCQMLGYTESEMLNLGFQDITHPDDVELDVICIHQLLNGEIPYYHRRKRYLHKEGYTVWGVLSVALISNGSNQERPLYFVAQIQPVHDRVYAPLIPPNKQA